jgi:hypothetical protein
MPSNDGGKVISGGLVIPMRPQVSVELLVHGDIVISTATVSDDFSEVEHKDIRFPIECAREIAAELIRLADMTSTGESSVAENPFPDAI